MRHASATALVLLAACGGRTLPVELPATDAGIDARAVDAPDRLDAPDASSAPPVAALGCTLVTSRPVVIEVGTGAGPPVIVWREAYGGFDVLSADGAGLVAHRVRVAESALVVEAGPARVIDEIAVTEPRFVAAQGARLVLLGSRADPGARHEFFDGPDWRAAGAFPESERIIVGVAPLGDGFVTFELDTDDTRETIPVERTRDGLLVREHAPVERSFEPIARSATRLVASLAGRARDTASVVRWATISEGIVRRGEWDRSEFETLSLALDGDATPVLAGMVSGSRLRLSRAVFDARDLRTVAELGFDWATGRSDPAALATMGSRVLIATTVRVVDFLRSRPYARLAVASGSTIALLSPNDPGGLARGTESWAGHSSALAANGAGEALLVWRPDGPGLYGVAIRCGAE